MGVRRGEHLHAAVLGVSRHYKLHYIYTLQSLSKRLSFDSAHSFYLPIIYNIINNVFQNHIVKYRTEHSIKILSRFITLNTIQNFIVLLIIIG